MKSAAASMALFAAMVAIAAPAPAQQADGEGQRALALQLPAWPRRITSEYTLRSAEGLEYRIFASAPAGPAPAAGYPVVYVLDGNAWFGAASEIARLKHAQYGPALVIGVGYPGDAPMNFVRRERDFTLGPPKIQPIVTMGSDYGGAPAFRRFLTDRLRRDLARRFPLASGRHTLFGHSLGGLFALQTYLTAPDAFDAYIAASPSIWWDRDNILRDIDRIKLERHRPASRILLEMGGLEQAMTDDLAKLAEALSGPTGPFKGKSVAEIAALVRRNIEDSAMVDNVKQVAERFRSNEIDVPLVIFEGEDHGSVLPPSLGRAVAFGLETKKR